MVKARIDEDSRAGALMLAGTRLNPDQAEPCDAMDGELAAEHRFVLPELMVRGENLIGASVDCLASIILTGRRQLSWPVEARRNGSLPLRFCLWVFALLRRG